MLSNSRHGLKAGDRVKSRKSNYLPFTGTVVYVWTDLVKVQFDEPQGPHGFTVTPGDSVEKLGEAQTLATPSGTTVVIHGDGRIDVTAPEIKIKGTTHGVSGGLLMNAELPPQDPGEFPAIVYPLVEGDPKQP